MRTGYLIPSILTGVAAACAVAGQPGGDEHADLAVPSIIVEHTGVSPGGTVWVGVHFEIKDGWHTYWPGQNDTGLGTGITVTAPDGVVVGEPSWPVPHRYIANGGILDHVHEDAVTALIPVRAPDNAEVGSRLELSFDLEWLVCNDVCIPGWETLNLSLPVVLTPVSVGGTDAQRFEKARGDLPVPNVGHSAVTWDGEQATITSAGAGRLLFYPDNRGSRVADLLESGDSEGSDHAATLVLTFEDENPTLSGVLEVHNAEGEVQHVSLRSKPAGRQDESAVGSASN